MLRRFVFLSVFVLTCSAVPSSWAEDDVEQMVADYQEARDESAAENSAFVDDEGDGSTACTISPFDPRSTSEWRGAGLGTPERWMLEQFHVPATDIATFQAACAGVDVPSFAMTVEYWFEAWMSPNNWVQVSDPFSCTANSVPGPGIGRVQVAAMVIPPALGCQATWAYPAGDSSLNRPHRLRVHLTTTTQIDMHGVSQPWMSMAASLACPPFCT